MLRCLNVCFSRIYHQVSVQTPCPLPRRGAGILVCNHLSGLDPVLIQAACPRLIRWMMAREYYQQRGLKWLMDLIGIIPVDRAGRDMAATRAALTALSQGYIVGIFPEGRIETSNQLLPFQPGIGLLAAKSRAPIYPVYLDGTQRGREMLPAYLQPHSASLTFGPPLALDWSKSKRPDLPAISHKIQAAVEILRQIEVNRRKIAPQTANSRFPDLFIQDI